MRLITWNCNMAFRRKADLILTYQPDILVVPECECPERLLFAVDTPRSTDVLWFGKAIIKGSRSFRIVTTASGFWKIYTDTKIGPTTSIIVLFGRHS